MNQAVLGDGLNSSSTTRPSIIATDTFDRAKALGELAGFPVYAGALVPDGTLPKSCQEAMRGGEFERCKAFHRGLQERGQSELRIERCHRSITCFACRIGSQVLSGGHLEGEGAEDRLRSFCAAIDKLGVAAAPLDEALEPLFADLPLKERLRRTALNLRDQLNSEAALLIYRPDPDGEILWGASENWGPECEPTFRALYQDSCEHLRSERLLGEEAVKKLQVNLGISVERVILVPIFRALDEPHLGVLGLFGGQANAFGPARSRELHQAFSLIAQTQPRAEEPSADSLAQVGSALATALNLEDLLRLILDVSTKLTRAQGGTIVLIEGQKMGDQFSTLSPENCKNCNSHLFLPISRHDRVKATLQLSFKDKNPLSEDCLHKLEVFHAQAAMAIENAQIFEWEQQRAREATALYQAARTIEESQELDDVLEKSTEVLARIAEVDRCLILLKDSHRSFLSVVAATGISADQDVFFSEFKLHLTDLSSRVRERLNKGKPLLFQTSPPELSGLEKFCSLLPTTSCLMVPLRTQEKLLGVIYLDSSRGAHRFPPSTVRRIMTLSLQVANAIHRASLIQQLQENLGPLKALYQVSTAITGTLSLPKVIRLIVDQAVELLEHSACALLVLDEIGESFRLETSDGMPEVLNDPSLQARLAKIAVERKRAYSHYLDRTDVDPSVLEILKPTQFGGLLSVPLIARKKMNGVLNCFVPPQIRFRQQEIRLLKGFANQAAVAVENARLHGMIRFKMGELGTLFEVSKAVTSTLRLDRVLGEIIRHVRDILRADACSLMLLEGQNLILKAAEGFDPLRHSKPIPVGRGVAGLAAKTGQPMVLFDQQEGAVAKFPARIREEGLKTILSVPIKTRGRTIGLVNVYHQEITEHTPAQLSLLSALGSQAAVAIENARLYADKERTTELLRGALIPKERLDFPGLNVGHRFIPSMDLSGDYYDLIPLGDKRCGLVIADVSGKGPEAAIQTVRAKHVIKSYAVAGHGPAQILKMLNEHVSTADSGMSRQVTVFYAEADLEARTLKFASAGHEPPLFRASAASQDIQMLTADGIMIGALPDANFEEKCIDLPSGSWLVLYTDGITEARSPSGEFFGLDRVLDILAEHEGNSAQRLVNRIYTKVRKFTREKITDDFSLLAVGF